MTGRANSFVPQFAMLREHSFLCLHALAPRTLLLLLDLEVRHLSALPGAPHVVGGFLLLLLRRRARVRRRAQRASPVQQKTQHGEGGHERQTASNDFLRSHGHASV